MKLTAVWTGISSESTTTKLIAQIIKAAVEHAAAFGEKLTVDRINLRDYTKKLALSALTPVPDSELEAAFKSVQTADAVVTISPIYKGAPIGIQTLFWQLIDDAALSGKPVLIGATGGTARHSLAAEYAIRPMLSYLKGIVLPSSIFAATDDWGSATGAAALQRRIDGTAKELVTALIGSKANHSPANTESSAADTAEAQDVKITRRNPLQLRTQFHPNQKIQNRLKKHGNAITIRLNLSTRIYTLTAQDSRNGNQ
ncbi:NAD(P)H-dependent oxidoreductase [Arcanobacterium hippocoleae]